MIIKVATMIGNVIFSPRKTIAMAALNSGRGGTDRISDRDAESVDVFVTKQASQSGVKKSDDDEDQHRRVRQRRQRHEQDEYAPEENNVDQKTADRRSGGIGITQRFFREHVVQRKKESVGQRVEFSGNGRHALGVSEETTDMGCAQPRLRFASSSYTGLNPEGQRDQSIANCRLN